MTNQYVTISWNILVHVTGVAADGRGDVRRDREDGQPSRPGENKGEDLEHADDRAHGTAAQEIVSAAQTEGAEGVDQIADGAGSCAEQEQMGSVAEIGQKLHAKQLPVVPALIGREEQRGPEQSDELCKHKKGSRFLW